MHLRPRTISATATLLLAATLASACGGPGNQVVAVPDDLCPQLLRLLAPDFAMAETAHSTDRGSTRSEASCSAAGRSGDGRPLTVTATVTFFGGGDEQGTATTHLRSLCDDLDRSDLGPVSSGPDVCEAMSPMATGTFAGVYALPPDGVLEIELTQPNPEELGVGVGPVMSELAHELAEAGVSR